VIDGDGHIVEPDDLWTERMDRRKWGDWVPRAEESDEYYLSAWWGGELRAGGREVIDRICAQAGITPRELKEQGERMRIPGSRDPDARVADMDRDGIDAAVLYPSQALFFGPCDPIAALRNVEFVLDCQRAYNEWLADFCRAHPRRLFGLGLAPLQSPELAVQEAQRCVGKLGMVGLCIRPSAYVEELPLSHPVYDRFWAACQDLDVPVALHPGVHVDTPGACRKFGLVQISGNLTETNTAQDAVHGGSGLGQAIGNAVDMIVSLGRLLMGGVCERFPQLRFLFLEAGGGWIPTLLERMDEQVKAFRLDGRWLKLLPSEYFKRQCYAGFECEEWNLVASAQFLGADRILWASDYPHPEYHPGLVAQLREALAVLPHEAQRRILGQNAIDAYRLPLGD
jgi:predicted TIM-barrel fold metal-dependent hydrolase